MKSHDHFPPWKWWPHSAEIFIYTQNWSRDWFRHKNWLNQFYGKLYLFTGKLRLACRLAWARGKIARSVKTLSRVFLVRSVTQSFSLQVFGTEPYLNDSFSSGIIFYSFNNFRLICIFYFLSVDFFSLRRPLSHEGTMPFISQCDLIM